MFTKPNLRMILWATLAMALLMNYVTWLHDYPPAPPAPSVSVARGTSPGGVPSLDSAVPRLNAPVATAAGPATAAGGANVTAAPNATTVASAAQPAAQRVHVVTDVLDVQVSLAGGELSRTDLLAYPLVKGQPAPVRLLNRCKIGRAHV